MNQRIKYSIIIPAYNEVEVIEKCVNDVSHQMSALGDTFEIIVVDDGSNDGSLDILNHMLTSNTSLRVIRHLRNRGNGAALRTGIVSACGDIILCIDSDGQHRPSDIPKILENIPPYDMVVGARNENYKGAWYRNLANSFYNRFASWLTQFPIEDLTSGFRAMRRSTALHFLPLFPSGFSAPTTSTLAFLKAGYNIKYIPIDFLPREQGKSKINLFKDGQRFILIMLRMITLYDPMRIFLPVTFGLGFLGIISWVLGILQAGRLTVPGSTVVLFIAGVLSLLLGLVSSQIVNLRITYYGDEYIEEIRAEGDQSDGNQ